ncbi:MAG: PQQ-like beta-propeller repeat protein [Planctomycetaceae bacterium]|nr:PQQ-like beta-propeller repeat protein [Planctomycetaceae bacterium]
MATAENLVSQPAGIWRQVRTPALILAIAVAVMLAALYVPVDSLDRGTRRMLVAVTALAALLCLNFWWLLNRRVARSVRLGVEGVLLALLVGAIASVEWVEFTGDMTPIPHFRWEPSGDDRLEAHRAAARPGAAEASIASAESGWQDFAEYRGRKRDGVVNGPALARDWSAEPPRLVWRQPCGGGYASFALSGGRAITIEQRREREAVVAYDVNSGRELWEHAYPALFSEKLGGDGPRATPTVADGEVYALGATGILTCLDLNSGQPKWSVNILELNSVQNIDWGMAGSPLVYDDLVVVNPGAQQGKADSRGLVALARADGRLVWRHGTAGAGYSSPMLATIRGERQILIFDAGGLAGHNADGGAELWRFPWESQFNINVAQPLVFDGAKILISSSSGAALIEVDGDGSSWLPQELWRNRLLKCAFANPLARDGFVYGLDEGILVCLDLETGQRRWKQGRYGHGQMLLSGDLLLILSERGELVLVEATPDRHHELAIFPAIEGKTWNCPVLENGRAYIRNHEEMACYELVPRRDGPEPASNAQSAPDVESTATPTGAEGDPVEAAQ